MSTDLPKYADGSTIETPNEDDRRCWSIAVERFQAGPWIFAHHRAIAVKAERERVLEAVEAFRDEMYEHREDSYGQPQQVLLVTEVNDLLDKLRSEP